MSGILAQLGQPDVLDHPDAGDGVVRPVGNVTVVLHPDLHLVLEAQRRDGRTGEVRLFLREGDAHGACPRTRGPRG